MTFSQPVVTFSVLQLGSMSSAELDNTVRIANQVQGSFHFDPWSGPKKLPPRRRRSAGGYDLDAVVRTIMRRSPPDRPAIFVTTAPYSGSPGESPASHLYFADYAANGDSSVGIVSTFLWSGRRKKRALQPYLLFQFAAMALSHLANLEIHEETRGCPFDYCDNPQDFEEAWSSDGLCNDCLNHLSRAIRAGDVGLVQVASALRLLNRGLGRRAAFVAMPFARSSEPVYSSVRSALSRRGWVVRRADEIARPRRVTDAMLLGILESDLVVADLTGGNPNVCYEVGFAHAAGREVILVTQNDAIPFDLASERTVFYETGRSGLARLSRQLARLVE